MQQGRLRTGRRGLILAASALALGASPPALQSPTIRVTAPDLTVVLDARTQTLISLLPRSATHFDFAPGDHEATRHGDGYYHLGDIDLRLRWAGGGWRDYSSALHKGAVTPLPGEGGAAADLAASFPPDMPLDVERRWSVDDGALALRFRLTNRSAEPVEIGGLGLPMVFDNTLTDRTLEQAHEGLSFADPYIGRDAGYLQVTRLNGKGPALLVLPERGTPFEAYKPILDQTAPGGAPKIFNDPTKRGTTFEGFHDWMVASKAFAETDWKGVREWNAPTGFTLAPGESRAIGVRFVLSPSIRQIEDTLIRNARPVAIGIPGYVLPTDLPADLFLKAPQPVTAMTVEPQGAIAVTPAPSRDGWLHCRVEGRQWGRARLTVHYADGTAQTISYFVTKAQRQAVGDLGHFLFTRQWFDDRSDPFHRAPSIISYDHDTGRQVLQDQRVWIAGLSDEGGAGSWLAAIMKQLGEPDPAEIAKFETFVTGTLDGRLQVNQGPERYGVRKSLFYYDPAAQPGFRYDPAIDWKSWSAWNRKEAYSVGRSFNYVHVAAAYWVLYRLARYHDGLVRAHDWRWYLAHAAETAVAMQRLAPDYAKFGQMEGNVYVSILRDLKREGMTAEATKVEQVMRARADRWAREAYPFGSEMPWDSTGQSEIYDWMRYFGDTAKAIQTREVILGYDPAIPSWGYNGSARRYWDFNYAGKTRRIERQLHHYGSSSNALPLFDSYRRDPNDFYLLRVAYGGLMGPITNISEDGFGSAAFHSFPDMMRFDGYSGDYGTNFFGIAYGTASYLVDHPTFGWIGFGGIVSQDGETISIAPRDSFRMRVFVAPAGLWLTLRAGALTQVDYDRRSGRVRLHLAPRDRFTPAAVLDVTTTTESGRPYHAATPLTPDHGGWRIALSQNDTLIDLLPGDRR